MLQRLVYRGSRISSSAQWHSSAAARRTSPRFSRSLHSPTSTLMSATVAPSRRWYTNATSTAESSSKPSGNASEKAPASDATAQATEADSRLSKQLEEKTKELEAKNKEIVSLKDQYLRQVADYRNLQDRTKREVQAARDFGIQRFSADLLDSIDNLDRAISNTPAEALATTEGDAANKDLINLHSGLKMTETILMQALKKNGLIRFDPAAEEEKFDPNRHDAIFHIPQPDKDDGMVIHTESKGFSLNGRIVRPARVGVVKNA